MRYELRLYAYDVMDMTYIRLDVDATGDDPLMSTARVVAKTALARTTGSEEATEWTLQVLETMIHGLR